MATKTTRQKRGQKKREGTVRTNIELDGDLRKRVESEVIKTRGSIVQVIELALKKYFFIDPKKNY